MKKLANNYAFIDGQNLYSNVRAQGWMLDFARFRVYLSDKYHVTKAYIFIVYLPEHNSLYKFLKKTGYVCIFKPVVVNERGITKSNCDAELVLQTMIEFQNFDNAILVTGDGDFYCLALYLLEKEKLHAILIPNKNKFSALFKFNKFRKFLRFVNDLEYKMAYKKEKTS